MSQTIACRATLNQGIWAAQSPLDCGASQGTALTQQGTCRNAELVGEPCFHLYPKFQTFCPFFLSTPPAAALALLPQGTATPALLPQPPLTAAPQPNLVTFSTIFGEG